MTKFTEDEMELILLALSYYRRFHLGEYSEDARKEIARDISSIENKLR